MYVFKKIFRFFWAFWGALVFFISLLVVTPLYVIIFIFGGKNAERTAHKLSHSWAVCIFFMMGIILKVHGKEKLDQEQTYVFISNHSSILDIPVCVLATKHFFKYLAKEELTRIPLLGYIIKRLYLTVSRQDKQDRIRSIEKMTSALRNNISVWIYPEGTRNKTKKLLKDFYDGAFRLSVDSRKPLATLVIVGARELLPSGELLQFSPGIIHAYWLNPVLPPEGTDANVLKADIRAQMTDILLSKR
jgi:1-acyl-sn-glycerol-3-phosphate acyltransferase